MTDLQIFHIPLQNLNGPLPLQALRLHTLRGVFYQALGGEESALARSLHAKGENGRPDPAPYAIGPLFSNGHLEGLRVATLQDRTQHRFDLGQATAKAWNNLKGRAIPVGSADMKVLDVVAETQCTYEQIWAESEPNHGLQLRFEMPARFSQYGRDHLLPTPHAIWQFYLLRWNRYSGLSDKMPPEILAWVEHQVHAMELTLETRLAYIEGNSTLSGVMGDITFQAFREKKPPKGKENTVPESQLPHYLHAWQTLASLAEYCGTGMNADIGMGRTRVVSRFGSYRKETG
ncbi:MAG: CRISPR system precrRNA processing endoribonuclease RAMP protein Cas6 [Chloroflexota bacterium]